MLIGRLSSLVTSDMGCCLMLFFCFRSLFHFLTVIDLPEILLMKLKTLVPFDAVDLVVV
jgi:hypothetical protein